MDSSEKQDKGRSVIRQLTGDESKDDIFALLDEVCPDFKKVILEEQVFGNIWSRSGLSLQERCKISLGILVAKRQDNEVKAQIKWALNIGVPREQILEVIMQAATYTIWGAGIEAIRMAREVFPPKE
ncbi:carboxymuconolactone decarboxylase family protein [Chloroflexota bacterium]